MSLIIELFNALVKLSTLVFIVFFFSNYIELDVDLVSECMLNMENKILS